MMAAGMADDNEEDAVMDEEVGINEMKSQTSVTQQITPRTEFPETWLWTDLTLGYYYYLYCNNCMVVFLSFCFEAILTI